MQFNIDEMFDNHLRSSPSTIDDSNESGEEFVVEPGNVQALDERFRVGGPSTDAMSAFVGAAAANFIPSHSLPHSPEDVSYTTGSQIERQLMGLVGEQRVISKSCHCRSSIPSLENHQSRRTIRIWRTIFH